MAEDNFFGTLAKGLLQGGLNVLEMHGYLDRLKHKSFSEKVMICEDIVRKHGTDENWNRSFGQLLHARRQDQGEDGYEDILKALGVATAKVTSER